MDAALKASPLCLSICTFYFFKSILVHLSCFYLQKYFGFTALHPYQRDVINQVTDGRDCLVVMATGAGKSLWYSQKQQLA
jgi:superfamily II DNA helicase RecQ